MPVPFVKYSGCGNDFIIIDNRIPHISATPPRAAVAALCHRHLGIGADGLILLENSRQADFRMRIFNADGGEAEMCGNGIRCLAHYLHAQGTKRDPLVIETMHTLIPTSLQGDLQGGLIRVNMPPPRDFQLNLALTAGAEFISMHYLDTGVPHAVIFVEDLDTDRLLPLAPGLRFHPHFHAKGTNVNLARLLSANAIGVRTFERGVEKETLACGTGAVAVALSAAQLHDMASPIAIHTRSKDILQISFNKQGMQFSDVSLTGPAVKTFHGEVSLTAFGFSSLKQ